jgi:hypothetical protein
MKLFSGVEGRGQRDKTFCRAGLQESSGRKSACHLQFESPPGFQLQTSNQRNSGETESPVA